MKFGYNMFSMLGMEPRDFVAIARKTEELGYDSIWMPDHFIFPPVVPPSYPYSPTGESSWTSDTHLYDPFVLLSNLAAATSTLKLGVHVFLLPLRESIATARAVATLDRFSDGRVLLGVGLGWLKDEYDVSAHDWKTRGAVMDESLQVLKLLWTQKVIDFRGRRLRIGPCMFEPKPFQKPHPPILVGGIEPPALRRAARIGDGWMGLLHDPEESRGIVDTLRRLLKENGRDSSPFEISVMSRDPGLDEVRRYEEAGVHRLLVFPAPHWHPTPQEFIDGLSRFADGVIARLP